MLLSKHTIIDRKNRRTHFLKENNEKRTKNDLIIVLKHIEGHAVFKQ